MLQGNGDDTGQMKQPLTMAERVENSGKGLDGSEELMEVWRSCCSIQMRGSGDNFT